MRCRAPAEDGPAPNAEYSARTLVLAVYSIRCDSLAVQAHECQDLATDGVNGRHNLNNGVERDHGHLKQRLRPMRGFKRLRSADTVTCGHALVQHLRTGFSALTVAVPRQLRLAAAWPERLRAI